MGAEIYIGTAGWSLPRVEQPRFSSEGTHLERYARVLNATEINASFYRPIRAQLYAKWAASTPPQFRFSVKLPRTITHEHRLVDCEELVSAFLDQTAGLGHRLGCILIQLPPSLRYDAPVAATFLDMFRTHYQGETALEPRHRSWFTHEAACALADQHIARVAADPAVVPDAATPAGATELAYFRLHGSPRVYWSRYENDFIDALVAQISEAARDARAVWCIFDNTASGSAIPNALETVEKLSIAGR